MKLFLVRHGQTNWNIRKIAQGRTDIPLNETGIAQAEELRDKIKDRKFDVCFTSPLIRAKQTAEILVNGKCPIIVDDLLMERSFGKFEGTSPSYEDWVMPWTFGYNNDELQMEPLEHLFTRTKKFLEKVKATYPDDARILVVSHGGTLKTMHYNIVGYDEHTNIIDVHFHNGDLYEYEI